MEAMTRNVGFQYIVLKNSDSRYFTFSGAHESSML
jgi:hypothetical protein